MRFYATLTRRWRDIPDSTADKIYVFLMLGGLTAGVFLLFGM